MLRQESPASTSPAHLLQLGRIVANFAELEDCTVGAIWVLLGWTEGQIVAAQLSFRQRVALLGALMRHRVRGVEERERLRGLLGRLSEAEDRRNLLVHSRWLPGDSPQTLGRWKTTAKVNRGLAHQYQQVTVDQLREVADFIADVAGEVRAMSGLQTETRGAESDAALYPSE